MTAQGYVALDPATLAERLGGLAILRERVGPPGGWRVREVGDGNLNLVFIVTGAAGQAVVKQALPYVRLVGESWPLPLKRAFFEYHALMRQQARDPAAPRLLEISLSVEWRSGGRPRRLDVHTLRRVAAQPLETF